MCSSSEPHDGALEVFYEPLLETARQAYMELEETWIRSGHDPKARTIAIDFVRNSPVFSSHFTSAHRAAYEKAVASAQREEKAEERPEKRATKESRFCRWCHKSVKDFATHTIRSARAIAWTSKRRGKQQGPKETRSNEDPARA